MIEILNKGLLTLPVTVSRHLLEPFGVPTGGPADPFLCILANRLVENPDGACALEASLMLPGLVFRRGCFAAIAGFSAEVFLKRGQDAIPFPLNRTVLIEAGDELLPAPIKAGMRAYIAVSGGIERKGFRAGKLTEGTVLAIGESSPRRILHIPELPFPAPKEKAEIRVIPGVQESAFSREGKETFYASEYSYTPESSRMGIRLKGEAVSFRPGCDGNIISEGMLAGDIQITPSGQPILMLSDCPTTGGYTKIAHAITADIPLAAQLRPGARIRFRQVSVADAHIALRRLIMKLDPCVREAPRQGD